MSLVLESLKTPRADQRPVEIVERKGLGHPDTICDALSERLSLELSRFYRERFGGICHHNVDKALLRGGASTPAFGGGRVDEPIEIFLAGRATARVRDVSVPIRQLAIEGTRTWFAENLRHLEPERHLRIHDLVRPGSADLVELFERQQRTGVWLSNDTSCGVGHAPLSELETLVDRVERHLTAPATHAARPAFGEDVKVMGVRREDAIELTVSCALVDRHLRDLEAYGQEREAAVGMIRELASSITSREVRVRVNAADDLERGSIFLTVTGTSAEAGDDGEAGRGNRVNGLIAPGRAMTMESVAGKNPVSHVGKIYNIAASLIAEALVQEVEPVVEAECRLVSCIGHPVGEPQIVHVAVHTQDGEPLETSAEATVRDVVAHRLAHLEDIADDLVAGRIALDRWPLRA